jgi:hypothetical protein
MSFPLHVQKAARCGYGGVDCESFRIAVTSLSLPETAFAKGVPPEAQRWPVVDLWFSGVARGK